MQRQNNSTRGPRRAQALRYPRHARHRLRRGVAVTLVLLIAHALLIMPASSAVASPFSFTPLGDLSGGNFESGAYGVSADGSVVVGFGSTSSGIEAFRWTAETGMVG